MRPYGNHNGIFKRTLRAASIAVNALVYRGRGGEYRSRAATGGTGPPRATPTLPMRTLSKQWRGSRISSTGLCATMTVLRPLQTPKTEPLKERYSNAPFNFFPDYHSS